MRLTSVLVYLLAVHVCASESQNAIPLNLVEAITLLNQHRTLNYSLNHVAILRNLGLELNRFWHERVFKTQISNISHECGVQIGQFSQALESKQEWAFRVVDSFGKLPSGIMEGNLAWLGEFTECLNITAVENTWIAKYALYEAPIDPLTIFKPGASLSFKYGMCVPNNCSRRDIAEIINLALSPISTLNKANESFIQIKEPLALDTGAIATISILAVLMSIVVLASLYDFCQRYRLEIKYSQIPNSNLNVPVDESPTSLLGETSESNTAAYEVDFEKILVMNRANDPVWSRILLNFSAYSNTNKMLEVNANSSLKCLNGIRVLSLAWIILGHTYIFTFAFSDNLNIITSWMKQFQVMIISNAFFSVDSFFFLSGFLTCYVFMRETGKTSLNSHLLIKYYFHRIWRLTPVYAIAYLISLNLSPYLSYSPLYPSTGLEPEYCKYNWWINFLYINNLINADKMCFGLAWYLANDTQFHFIAPVILIPFALKKKTIAYFISALFLAGNSISIAATMYLHEGMEAAQYGLKFDKFFSDFYVLPWCRMGPYVVGILTAYIIIENKNGVKLNKILDYFFWLVSFSVMSLMVFGLYPDSLGTHPLSRTTRIFYQSFCRTLWSVSLGYLIFSCAQNKKGLTNKILGCSVWSLLSKISYSAFLIHVLVIVYFNASQEHLIHMQHSVILSSFLVNWVVAYVLAFFFYVFFEAPLIGLEKFIF